MGIKSVLIKPFARRIAKDIDRWSANAVSIQLQIRENLIRKASLTLFGQDHGFDQIKSYEDFKNHIQLRDYEQLKPYVEKIKSGASDILWPGRPKYFAKTSGTTSGVKYIPLTKDSIPNHFNSARNAMFNYAVRENKFDFFDGRLIFLSGSPELTKTGDILTGRLSGIVNHQVPSWLKGNQLPSYETNCIEAWEEKLERIVEETIDKDMHLISGIPPWVQMYYEKLLERSGKPNIKALFPNYKVFVYGGVNYEPYRSGLEQLVGDSVDSIETYPASEGFIAFQDGKPEEGLLLNSNSGIFFEFVPASEIQNKNPTRLHLGEVELGVNYAIIINNNAGLWAYNIGDTVEFVSLNPYRLRVTGRIKHFISAFGEHVIGKEVDEAIKQISNLTGIRIIEYTVAPQVNPSDGALPYHEWFIEFETPPRDLPQTAKKIDEIMTEQNIYYKDLIEGAVLQPLKITVLQRNAFRNFMKDQGKLGGQNKVPRLSNDRKIAEQLLSYVQ